MQIASFIRGQANVQLSNSDAKLSLSNAGVAVDGSWAYEYWILFIKIEDSGTFDMVANEASVSLGVTLGRDSAGRVTLRTTTCSGAVGNIDIVFSGGASWLYNIFSDLVADFVRDSINSILCEAAEEVVNEYIAAELSQLALEFPIEEIGVLDYHLESAPVITPQAIQTTHRGEFFWQDDRSE